MLTLRAQCCAPPLSRRGGTGMFFRGFGAARKFWRRDREARDGLVDDLIEFAVEQRQLVLIVQMIPKQKARASVGLRERNVLKRPMPNLPLFAEIHHGF